MLPSLLGLLLLLQLLVLADLPVVHLPLLLLLLLLDLRLGSRILRTLLVSRTLCLESILLGGVLRLQSRPLGSLLRGEPSIIGVLPWHGLRGLRRFRRCRRIHASRHRRRTRFFLSLRRRIRVLRRSGASLSGSWYRLVCTRPSIRAWRLFLADGGRHGVRLLPALTSRR